jgi:hypothetical protein
MDTDKGIAVDAWVTLDKGCAIHCDVIDDQAQFLLGHTTSNLNILASPEGLTEFVEIATEVLKRWQEWPEETKVSFSVGKKDDSFTRGW